MIIISLDEYGQFEEENKKPLFIAGMTYEFEDDEEERTERARIRAYYKAVMADAGSEFEYPMDLHAGRGMDASAKNLAPLNKALFKAFPEFVMSGTYDGRRFMDEKNRKLPERKGEYALFVMLKSEDGKTSLLRDGTQFLLNDNFAANRYFHMAGAAVNRIVFHNPLRNPKQNYALKMDVASRSSRDYDVTTEKDKIEEFRSQGFLSNVGSSADKKFYKVMDSNIYRTLIAQEMLRGDVNRTEVKEVRVRSIVYKKDEKDMEFLYFADTLCSYLRDGLDRFANADSWLLQIDGLINQLNPQRENLVFGYDEIDNDFSKAWERFENKDYFNALCLAHDAKTKSGVFAEYYAKRWLPYLEWRICDAIEPLELSACIGSLSAYSKTNDLNQDRFFYLISQFESMLPLVESKCANKDILNAEKYKLYDLAMSAYCHVGRARQAKAYYDMLKPYASYVGLDAFLLSRNRFLVSMEDSFEWDACYEAAKDNVKYLEITSKMKRTMLGMSEEVSFLDEGKAISQLGRMYALRRNGEAEQCFKKALSLMDKNSADYKITQSYLLHYFADMGKRDEFEKEAEDYFDEKGMYKQRIKYLIDLSAKKESMFSVGYAFYVLVRGLWLFDGELLNDALWERLCNLQSSIAKKTKKEPRNHPWELIYKYLEFMAIRREDVEKRNEFDVLRRTCLSQKGETLSAIEMYADAEIADLENDKDERDRITGELAGFMRSNYQSFEKATFSDDGDERFQELGNYFTFMYR